MRTIATFLCLFMAAPNGSPDQSRQARHAEWAAALQAAALGSAGGDTDDLPEPLRDALRQWNPEESTESADAA